MSFLRRHLLSACLIALGFLPLLVCIWLFSLDSINDAKYEKEVTERAFLHAPACFITRSCGEEFMLYVPAIDKATGQKYIKEVYIVEKDSCQIPNATPAGRFGPNPEQYAGTGIKTLESVRTTMPNLEIRELTTEEACNTLDNPQDCLRCLAIAKTRKEKRGKDRNNRQVIGALIDFQMLFTPLYFGLLLCAIALRRQKWIEAISVVWLTIILFVVMNFNTFDTTTMYSVFGKPVTRFLDEVWLFFYRKFSYFYLSAPLLIGIVFSKHAYGLRSKCLLFLLTILISYPMLFLLRFFLFWD